MIETARVADVSASVLCLPDISWRWRILGEQPIARRDSRKALLDVATGHRSFRLA